MKNLKEYFFKEAKPFIGKRDVDWFKLKFIAIISLLVIVLVIFLFPESKPVQEKFYEKVELGSLESSLNQDDPTLQTVKQLKEAEVNVKHVHGSLDHLYRKNSSSSSVGSTREQGSSMILSRGGNDTRTQLLSGAKVEIALSGSMSVSTEQMPITGVVVKDVYAENSVAIAQGAKALGVVSFDESLERAVITWRSIVLADGRQRPFSAVSIGSDGQTGIKGSVSSDAMKNAVGQTLTRFVGAYASGSMNKGALGSNEGGHKNGIKNAVSETATEHANSMGEDLSKKRKWIELESGTNSFAILDQPFSFRDVGVLHE